VTTPWTIEGAGKAMRAGETTSIELVTSMFAASDSLDPLLGTYLVRLDEAALAAAAQADQELAEGRDRGPLHGIPLGIKDILATDDAPTTCQSLVQDPAWGDRGDGPVLTRLREAGAVIMGKTTTMEYAIGRPDFSKPFPIPRNPWDAERWAGGSSSGTANAVASGQVLGGLGTDTGGSVRMPAALCGISGHKPTFGLVPKSGCFPLGYSYDHIGPMCRSVWDCAAMLTVMAGADPSDRTTVDVDVPDYVAALDGGVKGLRIGVISNESIRRYAAPETIAAFDEALATLVEAGATTTPVEVPLYDVLASADFLGLQAEAYAYHRNNLAERWDDYGRPTRLLLATGAMISGGDLAQIDRVRQVGREQIVRLFEQVDVLVSPTMGFGAQPFSGADRRATSMRAMQCPVWNATGFPALAIPMGFDADTLPVSLQIIGAPFDDATCLRVGHAYQSMTDWHVRTAPHHA